ncbi:DEAD-box helicase [Spironucleus salmonicida]|uniref:DEAD-box helicase n=1 Tax=Spironucleus salmonicida TaxID=348837 RepID=V6LXV3_9EUKA|nr:DEAD-box helicase [Spironucleus salmonicida]|eukprot:EST45639.1 DEAD-box helicase [Spironucleus salmonicida]
MPPKKSSTSDQKPQEKNNSGFTDFGLKQEILDKIRENGFERPSDVQQSTIPQCLERNDIICQAKSGKGKTCVFVLSILQLLDFIPSPAPIQALVLCHTHELALQISEEFERFSSDIKVIRTVGKTPIHLQKQQIEAKSAQILVGTLGRVADLCKREILDLKDIKILVVDEADSLLSEKTKPQFADVMQFLPTDKQTMVFSATFSEEALLSCKEILRAGFKEVRIDDKNLVLHGLHQRYVKLEEADKLDFLLDVLKLSYTQAVIFTSSTERCRTLQQFLSENQIDCNAFYGHMNQKQREELYKSFKTRKTRIMVATDIFQRGVDFEGVNLVVHFDMPQDCDSYLHRSGRAGRFETNGAIISFNSSEDDQKVLDEIQDRFAVAIQSMTSSVDIDEKSCFLK